MGSYLACGIAIEVTVKKKHRERIATKDEIVSKLKDKLKLDIYDVEEDESNVNFILKKEIFEKNAISFIEEQLEKANYHYMEKAKEKINGLKGKIYEDLIEVASRRSIVEFQLMGGCDVSYISDNEYYCYTEIVCYILDGKILMECYSEIFKYLRELIVESNTNPIKDAVMITIA